MSISSNYSPQPDSQANRQNMALSAQRSTAYDPVDKFRVSTPQSLIDTDFEYGQQASKWEQVGLQNNRQSSYYLVNSPLPVTAITSGGTTTLVVSSTTTVAVGSIVFIEDTLDANANGWWYVSASSAGVSFTVTTTKASASGALWSATSTYVYLGYFYSGCGIAVAASNTVAITTSGTAITVNTTYAHGLTVGSYVYIVNTTGGTNVNGAWVVGSVTANNTFTIATTTASGTVTTATAQTTVYARPAGWVDTHAYDGSVNFTAGSSVPGALLFRQTRRYFRYQSGKGIQFSTGTILKPQLQGPVLTSVGTTVTVTTKIAHNLTISTSVIVTGADQVAYNGTFIITSAPTPTTFTYSTQSNQVPTASPATSTVPNMLHVSPSNWYGSSSRIGFFDNQNGFFFEYNGQTLSVVLRNSINQIPGVVSVTQGSGLVTGSGTAFTTQLVTGDYIVIRGMSYRILTINSDTALYISPEYRGATIANAVVSRTIDNRIPQSQWFDTCDGSGSQYNPSGYNIDLTKVQMFYIDYSWYGAGSARFGLRMTNGTINYVYLFQNNNVQYGAYMRSGNMCSHYEQNNISAITTLPLSIGTADTIINVASTVGFNPAGGTAVIRANAIAGAVENIAYTAITPTSLLGVSRGQANGAAATAFTASASAPVTVEYGVPDTAAMLSHWGSSVVMDGGYTPDVSAIYNYGMQTSLTNPNSSVGVPIFAIRIAPSVDNGSVGTLGVKEIINRLQLQMRELAVVTNTTYLIQLILNGITTGFSATFVSPTQNNTVTSSISQVAVNTSAAATITGGESIAAFYSNSAGQTTYDLTGIAPFGNAALGGGLSNSVPNSQTGTFPDGPDILYVVASPIVAGATNTVIARMNWAESQA